MSDAAHMPDVEFQRLTPAVRVRIDRVRDAVIPYLEREAETADYEGFDEIEVYEILIDMAGEESFQDTPVEALTARVLETMGRPARPAPPPYPAGPEAPVDDST